MMRTAVLVWSAVAIACGQQQQQPAISNAQLSTRPVNGNLENTIAGVGGTAWIGYSVPAQPDSGSSCCHGDNWRGCGLEGKSTGPETGNSVGPVMLEGAAHYSVLLRKADGVIGKVKAFAADCPIDAGGLPVVWLTGVDTGQSVRYLRQLGSEAAVFAVAMHAGKAADDTLAEMASGAGDVKLRRSAIFWLAQSRGKNGFDEVAKAMRSEPDEKVRAHAVFALMNSKRPEAVAEVLRVAKDDRSAHTRGQALFWLAQRASKEAGAAITRAIEEDPDTELKKRAVFALTQMKGGEGVPMLIDVARSNRNPAVRKQAIFWLGQSRDPRALAFIEEILLKR